MENSESLLSPRLLLDTHIVIRWLFEKKKLSKEQLGQIGRAVRRREPVALSAITLIEIAVLASDGKLQLDIPLRRIFTELESNPVFRILPVSSEVALEVTLVGFLRDPADRIIAATARIHRLALVTSDQRIIGSGLVSVIE